MMNVNMISPENRNLNWTSVMSNMQNMINNMVKVSTQKVKINTVPISDVPGLNTTQMELQWLDMMSRMAKVKPQEYLS